MYIVQISWCLLKGLYQQVGAVYSNFDRMRNIEKTSKPKHCSLFPAEPEGIQLGLRRARTQAFGGPCAVLKTPVKPGV